MDIITEKATLLDPRDLKTSGFLDPRNLKTSVEQRLGGGEYPESRLGGGEYPEARKQEA